MKATLTPSPEITIDGVVPIDEHPPVRKNGKAYDKDPIIRICHRVKNRFMKKYGVCVCYFVNRPTSHGSKQVTTVRFALSNTDEKGHKKWSSEEEFLEASNEWCPKMAADCLVEIEKYLKTLSSN